MSRRWLLAMPALIAAFAPTAVNASAVDTFDSLAGWQVVANGGNGVRADGVLRFSYGWGEVSRTFIIAEPSTVTLTVRVFNGNANTIGSIRETADRWRVALGGVETVGETVSGWKVVSLTTTTSSPSEALTVRLAGIDVGFWGGWYGPEMDDLTITAEPLTPPTTTTTVPPTPTTDHPSTTVQSLSPESGTPLSTVSSPVVPVADEPTTTSTVNTASTSTTSVALTTTSTVVRTTYPQTTLAPTTTTTLPIWTRMVIETIEPTTTTSTTITPESVPSSPPEARPTVLKAKSGTTMTPKQRTTVVAATLLLIFPVTTSMMVAGPSDNNQRRKRR